MILRGKPIELQGNHASAGSPRFLHLGSPTRSTVAPVPSSNPHLLDWVVLRTTSFSHPLGNYIQSSSSDGHLVHLVALKSNCIQSCSAISKSNPICQNKCSIIKYCACMLLLKDYIIVKVHCGNLG